MTKYSILGIAYEAYTPQVQARLFRDLLSAKNATSIRRQELIVACSDDSIDWLLGTLHVRKTTRVDLAKNWLVYYTTVEPELPDSADDVMRIQIPIPINKDQMVTTPLPNPVAPDEQGRDATFISLIDRPMPNGYTPTSPSPIAIWFGT